MLVLAVGLACAVVEAPGQVPDGPVKGFSRAEVDPATGRRRSLLRGESVRNISNEEIEIAGARFELFGEEEKLVLSVQSPQGIYHTRTKGIRSAQRLELTTADNRFAIEGVGFEWQAATSSLVMSNQVHATVRKDWLGERSLAAGPPGVGGLPSALRAVDPTGQSPLLHIYSTRLEYQPDVAVFRHAVRVEDPEGRLTADTLRVGLAPSTRRLETVRAEGQVTIESGAMRVRAQEAQYDPATEMVRLEGGPSWELGDRRGRAERVTLDRRTRHLEAVGEVEMSLPGEALGSAGGLWAPPAVGAAPSAAAAGPVLVRAEAFELRPEAGVTNVNVSVFRGRVRVDDPRGGLRCDVLTLRTRGEENRPESALAEGSVGLGQGEYQVRCARAYYLAEAGTVAMQGDTRWRMAGREGRSDQLQLGLADRVYRAMGHVSMRLASDALGAAPWLVPQAGSTSGPLEVQCDEFEFRTAAAPAPDVAVYRGGVRVLHPGGMTLDCEELRAEMAGGTNGVERVVAERHVEIRMSQEGGERWARGDQAIYRAGAGELELTGAEGIEFKVVDAKGAVQGRGRRALYSRARDRLELDGRPVLRTSHGDAVGDVVRLDRSHAVLSAAGQWRLRLPVRAADLPSVPAWPE